MRKWNLGRHKLICADSTNKEIVSNFIDGVRIQTIMTDPPYKMNYGGSGCFKKTTAATVKGIKDIISFDAQTIAFYTDLGINSIYIFCSKELIFDYLQIFKGWTFTPLVWCKSNPVPFCASSYLPDVEYLLCFSKPGRIWNKGIKPMKVYSRFYLSKKEEGRNGCGKLHPTMKPLKLIEDKILVSTTPGGIVFDGFGGSGTTLIAAENTGRTCYVVEHSLEYCQTIIRRWETLTGLSAQEVCDEC